jgi:hypothetical protein
MITSTFLKNKKKYDMVRALSSIKDELKKYGESGGKNQGKATVKSGILASSIKDELKKYGESGGKDMFERGLSRSSIMDGLRKNTESGEKNKKDTVKSGLSLSSIADELRKYGESGEKSGKDTAKSGLSLSSIADELRKYGDNGGKIGKDTAKSGLSLSSIADELKQYENKKSAEESVENAIRNAVIRKGWVGSSIADGLDAAKVELYDLEKIKRRLTGEKNSADGDAISLGAVEKNVDISKNPTSKFAFGGAMSPETVEKDADISKNPTDRTVDVNAILLKAIKKIDGKNSKERNADFGNLEESAAEAESAEDNAADTENLENQYGETEKSKKIRRKNAVEEKYRRAYEFYSEMDKETARRLIEGDAYLKNYLGKEYYERLRGAFEEG